MDVKVQFKLYKLQPEPQTELGFPNQAEYFADIRSRGSWTAASGLRSSLRDVGMYSVKGPY